MKRNFVVIALLLSGSVYAGDGSARRRALPVSPSAEKLGQSWVVVGGLTTDSGEDLSPTSATSSSSTGSTDTLLARAAAVFATAAKDREKVLSASTDGHTTPGNRFGRQSPLPSGVSDAREVSCHEDLLRRMGLPEVVVDMVKGMNDTAAWVRNGVGWVVKLIDGDNKED